MKAVCAVLLGAALSTQATIIHFALSPPGTDKAVGMSWMNEVPPPTNSTGTGGAISGGIVFDTTSNILHIAIGYGSAAGFSNLTGAATAMHIHGPVAGPGTNAGVLIPLTPYSFPAATPANGGVIYGAVPIGTNDVTNLLAGLNYINIHTVQYPGGEIRGQLVQAPNTPPTVMCPGEETVECGTLTQVTVVVSDMDGDALKVVWTVNGTAVQTNTLPASSPPTLANVLLITSLGLGTNHVGVTVTDSAGSSASCSTTVKVVDTKPPVITKVAANPSVLWPPNDKLVSVRVFANVTDTCDTTTWKIIDVTSDEPANAKNDDDKDPDWVITGDHTVKLRAEKNPKGAARTYTITIQAKDASGNLSDTKTVTVTVPKSQGHGDDDEHGQHGEHGEH